MEDDICAHVILELRSLPQRPGEAPPARRLARLLKACLRSYRFRCLKVGPALVATVAREPSGVREFV